MSRVVSAILLIMLTSAILMLAFVQQTNAALTWIVDDDGPADFSKIQDAINAANPMDTIYVKSGTYRENVEVKKSLCLIGEDRYTTVIDGGKMSSVIYISASNVKVQNFTLQNSEQFYPGSGVYIYNIQETIISNNIITNNSIGIYLSHAHFNTLANNDVSKNYYGIWGDHGSINNTIRDNIVFLNGQCGIFLGLSNNNTVEANTISNNNYGLSIFQTNNTIVHNNFINNTYQAGTHQSANKWDAYGEGNYWSNYDGIDGNRDGIGDTAYIISENGRDNYPLMGAFYSFNTSLGYFVNVISNSTVERFEYFAGNRTIRLYVFHEEFDSASKFGFCRLGIHHELMDIDNITVTIDNNQTTILYPNYNLHDNGTHRWIYFAYQHSTHEIVIIPEFPSSILLSLIMMATPLVVICKKKRSDLHLCKIL